MRLQRAAILTSIVLAMLIGAMDTTILNTTMPRIADALGGHQWYAWTFASYMIFSTVLGPVAGRLADLFGRKRVFVVGLLVFLAGSALCGWAGSMPELVFFRRRSGESAPGLSFPFPPSSRETCSPSKNAGKFRRCSTPCGASPG